MTRIFVHEHFSGNAIDPRVPDALALREAGLAMRDALVEDLLALPGVSVSCSTAADGGGPARDAPGAAAPARADPRLVHVSPHGAEPERDFVRRLARTHDAAWIVAPETGGVLAGLEAAVRAAGDGAARWIGCSAEAIREAGSKRRTLARLARHGLPTPALACAPTTASTAAQAAAQTAARTVARTAGRATGAWIVKPDDGAGTCRTCRFPDREAALREAAARRRAGEDVVVEPFVEGEPLSLSLVVGSDLARLVAINRQRIVVEPDGRLRDDGVQAAAVDDRDPRAALLEALARDVVSAMPGLRGFVGIDLVWNEERGPVLIEVNPRVTCAWVGLPARRGGALAAEVLAPFLAAEVADARAA